MPNWSEMFVPSMSILEIVFRGTAIYLGLWVILRVVVKREAGAVSVTDLLMVVLIADASQMRQQGIETISQVKTAWMEGDGHMSFIKQSGDQGKGRRENPGL